jgi:large repetitive protein
MKHAFRFVRHVAALCLVSSLASVWTHAQGEKLWDVPIPSYRGSPALDTDGTIYVVWDALYALNSAGETKWRYPSQGSICVTGANSPSIGADGTIYFTDGCGWLYAVSPAGLPLWSFGTGGPYNESPALGSDGTLYLTSGDNLLYAFNPDGSLRWTFPIEVSQYWFVPAAVVAGDGTIYCVSGSKILAINATGSLIWQYETHSWLSALALGNDGRIYFATRASECFQLMALNPDGTLDWQIGLPTPAGGGAPAIAADGSIYLGLNGGMFGVSADRSRTWYLQAGAFPGTAAIAQDNTVYCADYTGNIFALNLDGTVQWSATGEGGFWSSPAIAPDGTIYFGSSAKLYAFRGTSPLANSSWPMHGQNLRHTQRLANCAPFIQGLASVYIETTAAAEAVTLSASIKDAESDAIELSWIVDGTVQYTESLPAGAATHQISFVHNYGPGSHTVQLVASDGGSLPASRTIKVMLMDTTHGGAPNGTKLWEIALGSFYNSAAVAEDGTIYIVSDTLYALYPTGDLKWKFSNCDPCSSGTSSPAIAEDGTIYFMDGCGWLFAVNPNGTLRWRFSTTGPFNQSVTLGADGSIHFVSGDTLLYCLNPDGSLRWTHAVESFDWFIPPAVMAGDGTIYCVSGSKILGINSAGSLIWEYETNSWPTGLSLGDDGRIYFATRAAEYFQLMALNPDGTLEWRLDLPTPAGGGAPAIAADGSIYLGLNGGLFAAGPDGTQKWYYQAGAFPGTPAITRDGSIISADYTGRVFSFEPDGDVQWESTGEGGFWSSPTLAVDGTIYLGSSSKFYAFRGNSPLADTNWPMYGHDLRHTGRVAPSDSTPPEIICPADVHVECSPDRFIAVHFAATATDDKDASPLITYSMEPGSGFPVGSTTVTCTATDSSGNSSTCSFEVIRAPLAFKGFLAPIGGSDLTGGSFQAPLRTFNGGSIIPVKFSADCHNELVRAGSHLLKVFRWANPNFPNSGLDAQSNDPGEPGNQFHLTGSHWEFRLDPQATGMSAGIWELQVLLSDGSTHSAFIELK